MLYIYTLQGSRTTKGWSWDLHTRLAWRRSVQLLPLRTGNLAALKALKLLLDHMAQTFI